MTNDFYQTTGRNNPEDSLHKTLVTILNLVTMVTLVTIVTWGIPALQIPSKPRNHAHARMFNPDNPVISGAIHKSQWSLANATRIVTLCIYFLTL
jgi:hypothetical protein